jgi:hypothetical protein
MKIFSKDKGQKPDVMNVLALKDGKSVLINAAEPSTGVEVAPLGAMTLEDGTYELADGRKIIVAGGVITEVTEVEAAAPAASTDVEAIVAAVAPLITSAVDAARAEFTEALGKISSTHKPAKGPGVDPGKALIEDPAARAAKVAAGIRDEIVKSRKA